MNTRRFLRSLIDTAALMTTYAVVTLAYGMWGAMVATIAVGLYGLWCFWDGANRQ